MENYQQKYGEHIKEREQRNINLITPHINKLQSHHNQLLQQAQKQNEINRLIMSSMSQIENNYQQQNLNNSSKQFTIKSDGLILNPYLDLNDEEDDNLLILPPRSLKSSQFSQLQYENQQNFSKIKNLLSEQVILTEQPIENTNIMNIMSDANHKKDIQNTQDSIKDMKDQYDKQSNDNHVNLQYYDIPDVTQSNKNLEINNKQLHKNKINTCKQVCQGCSMLDFTNVKSSPKHNNIHKIEEIKQIKEYKLQKIQTRSDYDRQQLNNQNLYDQEPICSLLIIKIFIIIILLYFISAGIYTFIYTVEIGA